VPEQIISIAVKQDEELTISIYSNFSEANKIWSSNYSTEAWHSTACSFELKSG
jgi:hypothetical protein